MGVVDKARQARWRLRSAERLAADGDVAALQFRAESMLDGDAVRALEALGSDDAVTALMGLADVKAATTVSLAAIDALGRLRVSRAIGLLARKLADPTSTRIRDAAADALALIGGTEAQTAILEHLAHNYSHGPPAREAMRRLLTDDPHPDLLARSLIEERCLPALEPLVRVGIRDATSALRQLGAEVSVRTLLGFRPYAAFSRSPGVLELSPETHFAFLDDLSDFHAIQRLVDALWDETVAGDIRGLLEADVVFLGRGPFPANWPGSFDWDWDRAAATYGTVYGLVANLGDRGRPILQAIEEAWRGNDEMWEEDRDGDEVHAYSCISGVLRSAASWSDRVGLGELDRRLREFADASGSEGALTLPRAVTEALSLERFLLPRAANERRARTPAEIAEKLAARPDV